MRLVVVGATGRTGLRVVDEGLRRGAEVVALVRDPAKLGERRGRVQAAVVDVRSPGDLEPVLREGDVVVTALGTPRDDPGGNAIARGAEHLVAAMATAGARRVLGVSGAGVLLTEDGVPRHTLPDYPARFRAVGAQHQAMLAAFERSGLDWVLVCTPRLLDGDATGRLVVRRDHLPEGTGEVTTGDVAELLVREALAPTVTQVRLGVNQSG